VSSAAYNWLDQGRGQILPDGGLFVEETDSGRLQRFLPDRLLRSRVNWYDGHHIGAVSWSRYLTAEQVREPLAAIAARKCGDPGIRTLCASAVPL
jgi:hypothetical protein